VAKTQRVLVCGSSVALAGIETSLSLDPGCEVLSHASPISREELHSLAPDVVLFDLDAAPPSFVFTVSSELPGALLIGIDLETNRAMLWTESQAEGLSSQDLAQIIRHKGVVHEPQAHR
jgi:DNA-binding NarL/FixJ family response regulator